MRPLQTVPLLGPLLGRRARGGRPASSLRRQLLLSLLALSLPLVVLSPVSLVLLSTDASAHRQASQRALLAAELTDQQTRVAALTASLTDGSLVEGDPAALRLVVQRTDQVDEGFRTLLPRLRGTEQGPVRQAYAVWAGMEARLEALPPQFAVLRDDVVALREALTVMGHSLMDMTQALDEAAATNTARLEQDLDASHRATGRELRGLVALGVLGLLSAVLTARRLHRRIQEPLSALRDAAGRLGEDDLEGRVAVDPTPELGDLAHAFNAMADRLVDSRALMRAREQRFQALVQNSSDLITVLDESGTVTWAAPSAERVLGVAAPELAGQRLLDRVHADDRARIGSLLATAAGAPGAEPEVVRCRLRRDLATPAGPSSGEAYLHVEVVLRDLRAQPAVAGLVLTARDVSEQAVLHEQLRYQAFHDELTGLPNRALFADRVGHALSARRARPPAVLYCDLDGFKAVNDTQGHAAGDDLLVVVAQRLTGAVRPADTVARLGGDEFAVLLDDVTPDEAVETARRLAASVCEPVLLGDDGRVEVVPGMSIGVAVAPPSADGGSPGRRAHDSEELLGQADAAMYQAKHRTDSGQQVVLYDADLAAGLLEQLELRADLQRALRDEQFRLVYQPTVDLDSGDITGVEALVRWQHPTRGLVSPVEFIPLAEETGVVVALGLWVLETACRQVGEWLEDDPQRALHLSVNLSGRQLEQASIVDDVAGVLALTGLDPSRLTLELTESVLVDRGSQVIGRLHGLRALGVQLAIDDFGTGYSSLSYLQRLPVDVLKIDKSFVDLLLHLEPGSAGEALAATVVALAKTLGLGSVAEGIEHPSQAAALRELGCASGQGFLYARPLPPEQLAELLGRQVTSYVNSP